MPEDADAPICDLSCREIVPLDGDVDGVIPQYPILVLRDGGYVTGTYSRGKLALWWPDWHRPTRDMISIIILEAVLTQPGQDGAPVPRERPLADVIHRGERLPPCFA